MLNDSTSFKGESSTPFAGTNQILKKWQLNQVQKKLLLLQEKNQLLVQQKPSQKANNGDNKRGHSSERPLSLYNIMSCLFLYRAPVNQSIILKIEPGTLKDPLFLYNVAAYCPVNPFCRTPTVFNHFRIHSLPYLACI